MVELHPEIEVDSGEGQLVASIGEDEMIRSLGDKAPRIADSAFVSEAAYVVGDVEIGERSGVWPGAVVRGDVGRIRIGEETSVEDNCVVHAGSPNDPDGEMIIGNRVHIGHGAVVNGRRIGNEVLIGMNATVLHDAEIGNSCIIAAGTLVRQGMKIPDGSLVAGVPGEIKGKASPAQLLWTKKGPEIYRDLARRYKEQGL